MENKIGLIISREYGTRVKKKSFLLLTILVPLIILGFYAAIIFISLSGAKDKQHVAVIDESGIVASDSSGNGDFVFIKNETEASFAKKFKSQGYDAFLYVPQINVDSPQNIRMHSSSAPSLAVMLSAQKTLNAAIEHRRLLSSGIDPARYARIASDVHIESIVDSESGSKKSRAGVAYVVSFACGLLIYFMMIIYGTQVMRGVSEEKTSRIAEVIVSSVKPFQLMAGKIIGIGAVGLTQFIIWGILMFICRAALPLVLPHAATAASSGGLKAATELMHGLSSLPILKILLSFIFYFLGGYLTYAALFAAVGSMATDDQQDTQQLIFPILMPIILGFVIMTKAVADPNSSLAVFGSIFPLTSPIVMMARISYDIPVYQIISSMLLLAACFLFFTWLAARIYRVGILMYGRKPRFKDMLKWGFMKN